MIKRKILQVRRNLGCMLNKLKKQVPVPIPVYKAELLKGRTALITGASGGIGLAIASSFLASGASVIVSGRNRERVDGAVRQLKSKYDGDGVKVVGALLDISQASSLEESFARISEVAPHGKIDILVNNAAIMKGGSFDKVCVEDFQEVINTNLTGTFFLSRAVAKYMVANKIKGNILNVLSSSSNRPAISAYTLSKWGLKGLTKGLGKSLVEYGIVVNAIAPGPTATKMILPDESAGISCCASPSGRLAVSEEIANMAVVLASGMGRMCVGEVVYMTGGCGTLTYDDMDYKLDL